MSAAYASKWTPPTISALCVDCNHVYADRNDRLAHGAEEHGDIVRFLCHYGSCGEEFSSLGAALLHRKRQHGVAGRHYQYIIAYASTDTRTCRHCVPPRLFGDRLEKREHVSHGHHDDGNDDAEFTVDDEHDSCNATPDFVAQQTAQFRLPVRLFTYVGASADTNITVQ